MFAASHFPDNSNFCASRQALLSGFGSLLAATPIPAFPDWE
jgi:hypothetical protein